MKVNLPTSTSAAVEAPVGATHSRDDGLSNRDCASLLHPHPNLTGKPHGNELRKGRRSISGQTYLITTVTQNRRPVFSDMYAARLLVQTLWFEQKRHTADTLAYVVMPDHLHWLMTLVHSQSLAKVVQAIKASSAKQIGRPIWQAGFHDHALRQEEDLKAVARYIIANPLRAGLVDRIGDYPHWDAAWF